MNLNDIIIVGGIAVFLLPVVYLMGYARREKQHGKTFENCEKNVEFQRTAFKAERDAVRAQHKKELEQERNVIRELEISLLKAGEAIELEIQEHAKTERNRQISDGYRKAIIEALVMNDLWDFVKHSDVPTNMLKILLGNTAQHAVDPAVNQKAKNLFVKGVRRGAKMGREQMRKVMQKSVDNQANLIENLRADLDNAAVELDGVLIRRTRFRNAVMNVLDDKIALVSVRRAIKIGISTEVARLRLVDSKKGE